jgi:hypothetical protein
MTKAFGSYSKQEQTHSASGLEEKECFGHRLQLCFLIVLKQITEISLLVCLSLEKRYIGV